MAWIESHQSLLTHRKTARLARRLGIAKMTAIGHLHAFWWWAVDNAPEGDLSELEAADIADGACWEGEPEAFLEAMTYAGFVDADDAGCRIHEWDEYTGRLIEKRQANAERMREARAKRVPDTKTPRAAHVQRTSGARAGATVPNRTVPDLTEPETRRTGDDARAPAGAAAPEPVPKTNGKSLAPLVDAFRLAALPDPKLTPAEARAANELLRHWTPAQIAACWQDHASGDYGDAFSRRDLSFGYLAARNRVENWQRWHDQMTAEAEAEAEPPVYRNGLTHMPRAPGIYPQGVRCECGHVYSVMAEACSACGLAKSGLPQWSEARNAV